MPILGERLISVSYKGSRMTSKDLHTTQIFAPSWWVNTYEQTCHSSTPFKSPVQMGFESSQLPTMHITELNALLVLLSMAQSQIFSGADKLEIKSNDLRKLCTISAANKASIFTKAIQSFPSLRLFKGLINEDIKVARLFADESWNYRNPDDAIVYLTPTDIGLELILGYVEPYVDILRLSTSQLRARSYLQTNAPLRFWKSVWFDLKGLEQALLFRLEKVMQWDSSVLDLEGSFGCSVAELFSGLSLPKRRGKNINSKFQMLLKVLSKTGMKLHEHGMFSYASSADYLQESDSSLGIVWKASSLYLNDSSLESYLDKCANILNEKVFKRHIDQVFCLLLGGEQSLARINQVKSLYMTLESAQIKDKVIVIDNNCVTTLKHLLIEWVVRSDPSHELSLPDILNEYGIVSIIKSTDSIVDKYEKIYEIVDESHDLKYAIRFEPFVTMVSSESMKKAEVLEFVAKAKSGLSRLNSASKNTTDVFSNGYETKKAVSKKVEKSKKVDESSKIKDEVITNTLISWQESNRVKYEKLKKDYLNSLSADKRKIIFDVLSRLSPQKVDQHLKARLIKFMKENPDAWIDMKESVL